ncbi:MAG: HupE/UreJ family protein [Bacteroidia bacterium]
MHPFFAYLQIGFQHIANLEAYDHLVFVMALSAIYQPKDWRKVVILITAFTFGHSLTLALAALHLLDFPANIIEFCIPLTILITSLSNLQQGERAISPQMRYGNYALTLFFGLIHGLGFSNYLKMLLGAEEELLLPLFAFNVGLEMGQLLIIAVCFLLMWAYLRFFPRARFSFWKRSISILAAAVALYLILQQVISINE